MKPHNKVLLLGLAVLLGSVPPDHAAAQQSRADSVLDDVRDAQREFERLRTTQLPAALSASGAGCDEEIGRFCYWEDEEDEFEQPPEEERVTIARDSLIALLIRARAAVPDNEWITNQLIRYLNAVKRFDSALGALGDCGEDWWCQMLRAFTVHQSGDLPQADEEYEKALAVMPYAERCRWNDMSAILEDELRDLYRDLRCSQRDTLHSVVWWLADPFYVVPGNERRTEHFTRLVQSTLLEEAASSYAEYGPDVHELIVRFGWPTGEQRSLSPGFGRFSVTHHHSPWARAYVPPDEAVLDNIGDLDPEEWDITRRLPRSRYQTPYVRRVVDLEHQVATFLRGDSTLVVAAFAMPDSIPDTLSYEAALVLGPGGYETQRMTYADSVGPHGVLTGYSGPEPLLMSLEVLDHSDEWGGRARHGIRPPAIDENGVGVSDLLLFAVDTPELPETLADASFTALGTTRIKKGSQIGIYWESYGLGNAGARVAMDVTLVRTGGGLLRSIARGLGIAGRRGPAVELSWVEPTGDVANVFPRSISIDLGDTDEGTYHLELTLRTGEGDEIAVSRAIEVVDD